MYKDKAAMGGPITQNLSKGNETVYVPLLNHLLYDYNMTETKIYKVYNMSERADRTIVKYDLDLLMVPPPDWSDSKKKAAETMWGEINGT